MNRIAPAAAAAVLLAAASSATGCGPNWDALDPSVGAGGAGGTSSATGATSSTGTGDCTDLDDDNPCTDDACVGGVAIHTPDVGQACPGAPGGVCGPSGECVATQCSDDGDCNTSDCVSGASCKGHTCKGGTKAPAGTRCSDGLGNVCDGAGNCVECVLDADCDPPETCGGGGTPNACGCAGGATCASLGLTCGVGDDGCGGVLQCDNGTKDGSETDVDCGGLATCAKCDKGDTCAANSDCNTDHCVDGFCCGGACTGTCMSCGVPGNEGNCVPVPLLGTDTGCSLTMACDGNGVCKKADGQSCTDDAQCASGNCGGALTCE